MMKRSALALCLLALLCLAGCGEKDDYPTTALPTGMTTEVLKERLLELSHGAYTVVELEPEPNVDMQGVVYYHIVSSEDENAGFIAVAGEGSTLDYVKIVTVANWGQLENNLLATEEGIAMYETVVLQILADIGFDEALRAEAKEAILAPDWTAGEGILDAYLGGWTITRLASHFDVNTPGVYEIWIEPGEHQYS